MNVTIYKIRHVDLSRSESKIETLNPDALYFVFWYKSIPLGDLYFHPLQIVSEDFFWQQCWKAVMPSLMSYGKTFRAGEISLKTPLHITSHRLKQACRMVLEPLCGKETGNVSEVTVVICTRNRPADLKRCLTHLQDQVSRPADIIVIDNGSDTQETFHVTQCFPDVKYFREDRAGLDIARNRGISEAKSSIIAYTDDDTIPDPFWIFRIAETFQDPTIAAMTGLVIAASLSTEAEVIFEKFWPFNRGYVPKLYTDEFLLNDRHTAPPVWEIGAGANMAFRKNLFDDVGVFDERLDVGAAGCSGDSEMWYRILAHGFQIRYNPLAVVQHNHRKSVEGLKRQLFNYMRGFTVAMLIQYQRFGHYGNLKHLFQVLPLYYLSLLKRGFPNYSSQYKTVFAEIGGVFSGLFYYVRHRNTKSQSY